MLQITVPVEKDVSKKLNDISVQKRAYPWDDNVVDWSVPITSEYLYMPDDYSFMYGTELWDRLSFEEKSFVTRYEWTAIMRNAGIGEHMLNMGILSLLYHTDYYDDSYRYMLHEVAEECQHMAMFNEWCRLNDDIRTWNASGAFWFGPVATFWSPIVARHFTLMFWISVIMFEMIGDEVINAKSAEHYKNLHPIVQQMREAHRLEEARHIGFAKNWIESRFAELNKIQQKAVITFCEKSISGLLRIGFPIRYSKQLEPLISHKEFKQALQSEHRKQLISVDLAATVRLFEKLGLVRKQTIDGWYEKQLLV